MTIAGRKEEIKELEQFFASSIAEFLAIYGRRRVGKTFLIRSFFENKKGIFFDITGAKDAPMAEQIGHFTKQLGVIFYNGAKLEIGKNWNETFEALTTAIDTRNDKRKKVVLFFDEFPWLATKNSNLLQNLAYYWNQYWSKNNQIKLIICGSSASWIIDNIVNNKGGLHNRLTRNIHLQPFNLKDTKLFLKHSGFNLNDNQILQLYMVVGGVPYYLSKIQKGLTAAQNIDQLAFRKKAFFLDEFENLFSSLFGDDEIYIEIVRAISSHRYGMGQQDLLKRIGKSLQGKGGLKKLKVLRDTSFIASFKSQYHRKKGIHYKIIDPYVLFYFNWIEPIKETLQERGLSKGYWEKVQISPSWYSWAGYAFEAICMEHITQISTSLGLMPTAIPSSWKYEPRKYDKEQGAQIDLLFDRDDGAITICEIKYTRECFSIDKEYAQKLKHKIDLFRKIIRTHKQLFLSMISANGLKSNFYSKDLVQGVVTLSDLFL
jgi:hypothetical protein